MKMNLNRPRTLRTELALGHRHERTATLDRTLSLATATRLVLLPVLIASFMSSPPITAAALALFMGADLFDGVIARRLNADGFLRRAADSVVDRIAINGCLIAACAKGALPAVLLVGFIARDLACGALGAALMRRCGLVIKGDLSYRALTGSFAIWGLLAPALSGTERTHLAIAILAAAVLLAVDYARAVRTLLPTTRVAGERKTIQVTQVRRLRRTTRSGGGLRD